jgi:hypothetical protein
VFAPPGWVAGGILIVFAFVGLWLAGREHARAGAGVGGGPSVL